MAHYQIAGELTIYTAAEEKQKLLNFLDSDDQLELDLSKVVEFDSAGLQLLAALKKDAGRRGKSLAYVMHSKAVLDVLELADMAASFGDPIVLT